MQLNLQVAVNLLPAKKFTHEGDAALYVTLSFEVCSEPL